MSRYQAATASLGSFELVELKDQASQVELKLARRGATLLSLALTAKGQRHELADGFRDEDELSRRPGSRFAVMAPFANRIDDARYRFDGVEQDLAPGVTGSERAVRHGFLRGEDFEIEHLHADEHGAEVVFVNRSIRPGVHPGYPHALDVSIRYRLNGHGLSVLATQHNVGKSAAPAFFGWHPYFRLGDALVDGWELKVPARLAIMVDGHYIPLAGEAAYRPLAQCPELDFREQRAIGAVKLDQGYAELEADSDDKIRSHLYDPKTGLGLAVWQYRGVVLVFTADTAARDARRSVALEPMECMTNAFNRPDCAAAIRLEAGAVREFEFGVEIKAPR